MEHLKSNQAKTLINKGFPVRKQQLSVRGGREMSFLNRDSFLLVSDHCSPEILLVHVQ